MQINVTSMDTDLQSGYITGVTLVMCEVVL